MTLRNILLIFAAGVFAIETQAAPTTAPGPESPPVARVAATDSIPLIKSARSGLWSDPRTWDGGKLPAAGDEVLIHAGHRVVYDVVSDQPLRYVHVAGTLSFAPDRDTKLNVGLLVIRLAEDAFVPRDLVDLMSHGKGPDGKVAALEVGTADRPIDADHHAVIRLTYLPGMDKNVCPAIIDSGGRMDFHGAPLNFTWTKLKTQANAGESTITLMDAPTGWRVGDHLVIPTTKKISLFSAHGVIPSVRDDSQTEERFIKSIDGQVLTLDKPLGYDHVVDGDWRGEVADISRNVIVESSDPAGVRGHTMYHHGSTGSISYAEFRHLGKEGELGRYSLHFHLCGDTMRGSSIVGASIWDSANRWITIHGTNYMVVRDCVGYQSIGHGFFLENGTEEYNVFDHNLAIQATKGKKLPDQALAFDNNDGAGFWWANSLNTFTRNDAVECDQYGYRFEAGKAPAFNSTLDVRQPDGTKKPVDIRTLPFIRFEDNEAHSQRRFALNLGGFRLVAGNDAYKTDSDGKRDGLNENNTNIGDVDGVGPDYHHPFVIKNFRVWTTQWVFHSTAPSVLIDGLDVYDSNYGIWRSVVTRHLYHNISMKKMAVADVFYPYGGSPKFGAAADPQKFIKAVDDLPPATIITGAERTILGELLVTGTAEDNGTITRVTINGKSATAVDPNFATWEIKLLGPDADAARLTAQATDDAGNVELTPHVLPVSQLIDESPAPAPVRAVAVIKAAVAAATQPANTDVTGSVTFTQTSAGVAFVADLTGLQPNSKHVSHIHDNPDVSKPDLLSAGKQWRPVKSDDPKAVRRSSTIGVFVADSSGHAHLEGTMPGLTITGAGPSILNHTVIIHANGPGKAGARIAGGVIEVVH
jgi:Cu/Zn superoxide dismutase